MTGMSTSQESHSHLHLRAFDTVHHRWRMPGGQLRSAQRERPYVAASCAGVLLAMSAHVPRYHPHHAGA
jgi:hypothetical protein